VLERLKFATDTKKHMILLRKIAILDQKLLKNFKDTKNRRFYATKLSFLDKKPKFNQPNQHTNLKLTIPDQEHPCPKARARNWLGQVGFNSHFRPEN
jgi:hypothetical protein